MTQINVIEINTEVISPIIIKEKCKYISYTMMNKLEDENISKILSLYIFHMMLLGINMP